MNKTKNIVIALLSFSLVLALTVVAFLLGKSVSTAESSPIATLGVGSPRSDMQSEKPLVGIKNAFKIPKTVKTVAEIANEQGPTAVYIATYSKIGLEVGLGSGFVVSKDGKIITNFHVIDNAYSASIKLKNGEVYDNVSVIDYDERRDIALIKVEGLGLSAANLGDSTKTVVGDKVVVIGNPAGLENTVSDGIISASRDMDGYKLLQITAPISPGSSGGPVFNSNGDVIGIATSTIIDAQNLNFAVPIDYVKPLLEKNEPTRLREFQENFEKKKWIGGQFDIAKKKALPQTDEKTRGYLGIFWDLTQPIDISPILMFRTYSPGRDQGLEVGDVILSDNGIALKGKTPEEIRQLAVSHKEGDVSNLKILRNGQEVELKIKYGKMPIPTNALDAVAWDLLDGKKVRLAIMVTDINFIGPPQAPPPPDAWKKSNRQSAIDGAQQFFMGFFGGNKNFSIVDTGKIDVILNDLENRYGAFSPQVRDKVLESLGVTHLIEICYTRYLKAQFFPGFGGGAWKESIEDQWTQKTISLTSGDIICIDNWESHKDYDDKAFSPMNLTDPEDQVLVEYFRKMDQIANQKKRN